MTEPVEKHGWFHKWSRWSPPELETLTSTWRVDISVYEQHKECINCGLVKHRFERITPS